MKETSSTHLHGDDDKDGAKDLIADKPRLLVLCVTGEADQGQTHTVAILVGLATVDHLAALLGVVEDVLEALVVVCVTNKGGSALVEERALRVGRVEVLKAVALVYGTESSAHVLINSSVKASTFSLVTST